jgi:hypothetical protein
VLDVVDDGLSEEEIASRTLAWIEELRSKPPISHVGDGGRGTRSPVRRRRAVTSAVLDASAAVELVTRTEIGAEIAELVVSTPVLWCPTGCSMWRCTPRYGAGTSTECWRTRT